MTESSFVNDSGSDITLRPQRKVMHWKEQGFDEQAASTAHRSSPRLPVRSTVRREIVAWCSYHRINCETIPSTGNIHVNPPCLGETVSRGRKRAWVPHQCKLIGHADLLILARVYVRKFTLLGAS